MSPANETVDPELSRIVATALFWNQVEKQDQEEEHSLAVLLQITTLALSLIASHALHRARVTWIGEAGVALLLGVVAGMVVRWMDTSNEFEKWLVFQSDVFFIAILPPIIFHAGFSLDSKQFTDNLGTICTFAFAGTGVSTIIIAAIMYFAGSMASCYNLNMFESLMFGAIISATDPVTVLAVFQRTHADSRLYSIIFGESVLNDAVALVIYGTLLSFVGKAVTPGLLLQGLGMFAVIFVGSLFTGLAVCIIITLLVASNNKQMNGSGGGGGGSDHYASLLVILGSYISYYIAQVLGLSGIVSILFCGMFMAKYTRPNLPQSADNSIISAISILSESLETFVFIYIGISATLYLSLISQPGVPAFLAFALLAVGIARFVHVYGLSFILNHVFLPKDRSLPPPHQFMLWWAGLRGAMAFALAGKARIDLPDGAGIVIQNSTFYIVLVTVLVNGGGCTVLLDKLKLKGGLGTSTRWSGEVSEVESGGDRGRGDWSEGGELVELGGSSCRGRKGGQADVGGLGIPGGQRLTGNLMTDYRRSGGGMGGMMSAIDAKLQKVLVKSGQVGGGDSGSG